MKAQVGQDGSLSRVSDDELIDTLDRLALEERCTGAAIVAHLLEMERRRLHLDLGYSSLFVYCTERLGMSRDVAYKRMRVARAAAAYPEIVADLEEGRLSLATASVIAPHLPQGGRALIEAARDKSRREVERVIAESDPQGAPGPLANRPRFEPVAGLRVRMTVTVPESVVALVEEAVALDRHLDPTGDVAGLIGRALDSYVALRRKQRYAEAPRTAPRTAGAPSAGAPGTGAPSARALSAGAPSAGAPGTGAPSAGAPTAGKTHDTLRVPAAVKRAVAERDGHQCAFVGRDGHRCTEIDFLELDHVQPRALGGGHENPADLQLFCRAHNQRRAERSYGFDYMASKRPGPRERRPDPPARLDELSRDAHKGLVDLGFSVAEAKRGVEAARAATETSSEATVELFLRRALVALAPPTASHPSR